MGHGYGCNVLEATYGCDCTGASSPYPAHLPRGNSLRLFEPNAHHALAFAGCTCGAQAEEYPCGTDAAIAKAEATHAHVNTLFAIGFGGVQDKTLHRIASAPATQNAYRATDIAGLMEHFSSGFCPYLLPRPPPPPSLPPLPPPHHHSQ